MALVFTLPCSMSFQIQKQQPQQQRRAAFLPLSSSSVSPSSSSYSSNLNSSKKGVEFLGLHHVGFLCQNLERSLDFYCGILGLGLNPERPEDKLPYRGAWLWIGNSEMIHLMELPNPDPTTHRPAHGGRDRHACIIIKDVSILKQTLQQSGIEYSSSKSGRAAVFARDPDGNALEFAEPI